MPVETVRMVKVKSERMPKRVFARFVELECIGIWLSN